MSLTAHASGSPPNMRLKVTAHVGVCDLSPMRCSLSAIR